MDLELLRFRALTLQSVRSFFDGRGYVEVDTPLLSPDLIPESCLEVFETTRIPFRESRIPFKESRIPFKESRIPPAGGKGEAQPYWLIPSPEIWMKKLIARHQQSIYQICRCFRNGESSGRFHSPEFTMLEYYTMDADYRDSVTITEELFSRLGDEEALSPPFEQISMEEAFARWAGFDLYKAAAEEGGLEEEARRLGLNPPPALDKGALYDLIFVDRVEPALPQDHPVVLLDYPAFVPCLAKKSGDGKTVERWELYVRGIELANCYSEETEPQAVREFFLQEKDAKEKSALVKHRVDEDYWKLFQRSFPPCSGVAMGLDRLMMVLARRGTIDGVLPFPMV